MGLSSKGSFAKVWKLDRKEKFTSAHISISKKKQDGTYEQDFGGYVNLVGKAHADAANLDEGSRIKITDFDVSNSYNKDTKVTTTRVAVFAFEVADGTDSKPAPAKAASPAKKATVDEDDTDLPF